MIVTIFTLKKALPKDFFIGLPSQLPANELTSADIHSQTAKEEFTFSVTGNGSVTTKARMLETVDVY